jgi:hypothetical protein
MMIYLSKLDFFFGNVHHLVEKIYFEMLVLDMLSFR